MGLTQRVSLLLSLCLELACFTVNAQLECSRFTVADLGNTSELSPDGLLAGSLRTAGETLLRVPVKVNNYRILCDASGTRRNTSSYVSVLVDFQCSFPGGTGDLAQCDGMTNITRQYQYRCSSSNMWVNAGVVQTLNPNATFQTEPTNQCRLCDDPTAFPTSPIDPDTHCLCKRKFLVIEAFAHIWMTLKIFPFTACNLDQCNQGQQRCYIDNDREVCCNFYLENVCVAECPSPLISNAINFDCGKLSLTSSFHDQVA